MSRKEEKFQPALTGKKIPILTLDHKWHQLLAQAKGITPEIKQLEQELNALLKQQGKVNSKTKEIKQLKKKLMDEIVQLADAQNEDAKDDKRKELEDHKRLVEECNEKIDAFQDENLELPRQIDEANKKLMLATMELCYEKIQKNTSEIEVITDWINQIRVELKKKVITKQEKLAWNQELYSYMHDIFGAEVIELFDMKYIQDSMTNPEGNGIKEEK
ncbi:MAG: hypothetical protein PHP50_10260 [Lachnospiraceae bacterium]|nr:hypothetical protein [Lachnospiraceae bacterium]